MLEYVILNFRAMLRYRAGSYIFSDYLADMLIREMKEVGRCGRFILDTIVEIMVLTHQCVT